jgi:hypothetical protein
MATRFVPAADGQPGHQSHNGEDEHPEQGCQHDRGDEVIGLQPSAVHVEQGADARLPLGEEHVADDRADHHQACRGAHPGHDRRKRSAQFEFHQPIPARSAGNGEQFVHAPVDRPDAEVGVGDDGEHRDEHAYQGPRGHPVAQPQTDQWDDRENGNDLDDNGIRVDHLLKPARLTHQDTGSDAHDDGHQKSDQGDLRGDRQRREHRLQAVPVRQRIARHIHRRRQHEPPVRFEHQITDRRPHQQASRQRQQRVADGCTASSAGFCFPFGR